MANLITGLYDTETAAEAGVSQLKNMGYGQNEITIIMKDPTDAPGAASQISAAVGCRSCFSDR